MLRRETVLSMIGKKRYHSCICTSFSFDFFYFEMKVMRALNSAGVRNVTALVDGHYYNSLLELSSLQEFTHHDRYAIYPVFQNTIFHPKIMMLFGKHEGLMIVGSGNLTSSGYGGNDEIWGAFHFTTKNSKNAALIAQGWQYLQTLIDRTVGITQQKTKDWIERNTPWLRELPKVDTSEFYETASGESMTLLWQNPSRTIYEQLHKALEKETIDEVTVISPFYDKAGALLERYTKDFAPKSLRVVVDQYGTVPENFNAPENCKFFDWCNVEKEERDDVVRLHAKIHHFRCRSGVEYMLFGSSNATPEGLGLKSRRNEELCLLLRSESPGLLEYVGIKLTEPFNSLSTFEAEGDLVEGRSNIIRGKFKHILLFADAEENNLTVYSESLPEFVLLRVTTRSGNTITVNASRTNQHAFSCSVSTSEQLHSVCVVEDGVVISNQVLVHDIIQLLKTNPDPRMEEFEELAVMYQNGDDGKLLDMLRLVISEDDEYEDQEQKTLQQRKPGYTAQASDDDQLQDISKFSNETPDRHHRYLMLTTPLRMLDLLKFAVTKGNLDDDIREDEQITDISKTSGSETIRRPSQPPNLRDLRSQRHKVLTYFNELGEYFYLKRPDKLGNPQHKVSLTDLTKYAIALQLIEKYLDVSEPVTDTNGENFRFIQEDGDDWHKNLKGLMTGMSGWFLQLLTAEPKQYGYEHTRRKWEEYSQDALLKTAHFLCCVPWRSDELLYFRSLFLNNLLYLGSRNLENVEGTGDMVISYLEQKFKLLTNYKARYEQRLAEIKKSIIPSYYELVTNLSLKVEERSFKSRFNKSEFLYMKKYGVCYVTDISKAGDETFLTISRPGFEWDDEVGFISYQVKAKKFVPVG